MLLANALLYRYFIIRGAFILPVSVGAPLGRSGLLEHFYLAFTLELIDEMVDCLAYALLTQFVF